MARTSNKREKLLKSADQLFLQKGFNETTLADIAALAEVPLGNVYYYFKTKTEIISDVIEQRFKALQEILAKIEAEHSDPALQLKRFIQLFLNTAEIEDHDFGFMLTMMWVELGKENGILFKQFLPLPEYVIDWCAKKLAATSKAGSQANDFAFWLLASLQGACTMSKHAETKDSLILQSKFIEHTIGIHD